MFFMIVMIELIVMIVKGERGRGERVKGGGVKGNFWCMKYYKTLSNIIQTLSNIIQTL